MRWEHIERKCYREVDGKGCKYAKVRYTLVTDDGEESKTLYLLMSEHCDSLYAVSDKNMVMNPQFEMHSNSYSPALDIYFQRTLPKNQTLTLNLTGTLINSGMTRGYTEQKTADGTMLADCLTDVEGRKRSIIGEAIYDKNFDKLLLSAGLRHYMMRDRNEYLGTSPVT